MKEDSSSSGPRKVPKQARSREMVAKIVRAAALLVRSENPEELTTNRIAEIADVSKGSIYQYFSNKDEILRAALTHIAAQEAPAIENVLQVIALDQPASMMDSAIDVLVDYTIANRKLVRFLTNHPDHARTFEQMSGLPAVLLTMATLNTSHYRDQYRAELAPRTVAWLFLNMAAATALRYIETDDPIPLDELRHGLKFAAAGLLANPQR